MIEGLRLANGGRIDRSRTLRFTFDGRPYGGYAGDTLASALLANGVHLMGRSFKYHRPRGVLAAGAEEPNALVAVRRDAARYTPNLRATQVELYEGLEAHSQNRWPALSFDIGAVNDLLAPFIPAGFYYKTFMWPKGAWKSLYEPRIRAAAGLGRAPAQADPDRYAARYAHCDVLVVGAGPAGLAAAAAAAAAGARVMLCDEQSEPGGSLLAHDPHAPYPIDGGPPAQWLERTLGALAANARVTLLTRTTAFGYFPHNLVALNQRLTDHLAAAPADLPRERQWQVRAREVVLATGAIERPLVFPGNDRPGVMLAGAAATWLHRYAVLPGSRAVLVTATDEAYEVALALQAAGVFIAAIADVRALESGAAARARQARIPVLSAATVLGTSGRLRVNAIRLAHFENGALLAGETQPCDLVLMSGGYTPSVHLHSQSRGKLEWNEALQAFLPGVPSERVRSAGACRGVFELAALLADGAAAGTAARARTAGSCAARREPRRRHAHRCRTTHARRHARRRRRRRRGCALPHPARNARAGIRRLAERCDDEGSPACDPRGVPFHRAREALHDHRHGDRPGQDLQPQCARHRRALPGEDPAAGRAHDLPHALYAGHLRQLRGARAWGAVRPGAHHAHACMGGGERCAVFEDVGLWKRARYFPRGAEDMDAAVARECVAARSGCGIFDATTLGKIEVVGKDAVAFMNRLYVNAWNSLAVGRCRYGILLRDDGFVYDDGVVARLAADRFHVTTTTGGAPRVLAMMEDYLQTEWPDLDVWLTSTTEQWAVIAVQGPNARHVLAAARRHRHLGAAALPHMSVCARAASCGVPTRLFRVSFTGELGFEVNVPADFGPAVWEAIWDAGSFLAAMA